MTANTQAATPLLEAISPLHAQSASLAHLSDAELLTQTRSLVGRSNRLLAELLAHLSEVEARGIHRTRACSSLYTYCIYELRFSEDEAFRRVAAARLVRRFPTLLDAVATGELHLTGLLMLGPHLTEQNLIEVMARAKHRTKREIARLVRVLDPLLPVPARIEPLGPAPARVLPAEPTWDQFVGALNPVRNLATGERPREWGLDDEERAGGPNVGLPDVTAARAHDWSEGFEARGAATTERGGPESDTPARIEALATAEVPNAFELSETPAPAPAARAIAERSCALPAPQRCKVQFTATEEYVQLIDEAKALLSHAAKRATLEEIQLRALRAFVGALRKQKFGTQAPAADAAPASRVVAKDCSVTCNGDEPAPIPAHDAATSADDFTTFDDDSAKVTDSSANASATPTDPMPANNSAASDSESTTPTSEAPTHPRTHANETAPHTGTHNTTTPLTPRRRGRYIPVAIRRAVAARDDHCCTYVDACGRRCSETARLEFHHVVPFALAGSHDTANLTLRCAAHNALAAEGVLGGNSF